MKKVIFITSACWILLFVLYSCTKDKLTTTTTGDAATRVSTTRKTVTNEAAGCSGPAPSMNYELVYTMIDNYRNNQLLAIKQAMGINDAEACLFDLEKFKNYICHLEAMVAASQCPSPGRLGLRFYYAAHNANPPLDGVPADYASRHTLIVIPTYEDTAGNHIDFDPGQIDETTCRPLPLTNKVVRKASAQTISGIESDSSSIFAMDHGQLGPPKVTGMGF